MKRFKNFLVALLGLLIITTTFTISRGVQAEGPRMASRSKHPSPVEEVNNPAFSPFARPMRIQFDDGRRSLVEFPEGNQAVIEHISHSVILDPPDCAEFTGWRVFTNQPDSSAEVEHFIPLGQKINTANRTFYSNNLNVRIYPVKVSPDQIGTRLWVQVDNQGIGGCNSAQALMTLNGHLVPLEKYK